MKKIVNVLIVSMLCVCLQIPADAGNLSGTVTALFLKLPLSARAVGMGGAQVAVADGVSSMGYNPAGMVTVNDYGFSASYTSWFANISHSYAAVAKRIPDVGIVGASVIALSTDDIIETTPLQPDGTGRTFRASDFAFSLAFARQVTDQFMVGVNAKIIKSYLYNNVVGASSFAFDVGTLYDIPILRSRIGVSLTNIGADLQYVNEPFSLPTALRFGLLFDVLKEADQSLVTTLQVTRANDSNELYNLGAEYVFNNLIALRGGLKLGTREVTQGGNTTSSFGTQENEDVTAGFCIKLNAIGVDGMLDYGYNNFKYLPGTHSFTIELQF